MAANGGVVCINFYTGYLDSTYSKVMEEVPKTYKAEFDSLGELYSGDRELLWRARRQIYRQATSGIVVPVDRIVDHIDHVVKVAGIDHVGLGSDFDGVSSLPDGIEDASHMPRITKILVERGYSRPDIEKILGGNVMRVFGEVCGDS